MPNLTTMLLADAEDRVSPITKAPADKEKCKRDKAKCKMQPKRKAWSEEAREAAAESRRSGAHPTDHPAGAAHNTPQHVPGYAAHRDPFHGYQQAVEQGSLPRALTDSQRSALESIFAEHFGPAKKFDVRKMRNALAGMLARLSKRDYEGVQRLAEACRKAEEDDDKEGEKEKPQGKPQQPEPGVEPPPPGIPPKGDPRAKAGDKAANKARDLKHRAREASYNALDLDNSRKAHAAAADAHRAAADASEKALRSSTDPAAQSEFRNSQHSHNLHAAYHDKMSHSSDEDRKASAAARNVGKQDAVTTALDRINKITEVLQRKKKQEAPDDEHALTSPSRPERKRRKVDVGKAWSEEAREAAAAARSKAHAASAKTREPGGNTKALHREAMQQHQLAARALAAGSKAVGRSTAEGKALVQQTGEHLDQAGKHNASIFATR